MKIFYFLVISALILFQSCEKNIDDPNNNFDASVVQIGVLKYLDTGAFDGLLPFRFSLFYGDFGIGTLTGLDGAITILNNKVYRFDSAGSINVIPNTSNDSTPFLTVAYFKTDITKSYPYQISLVDLQKSLDSLLIDTIAIYAIKIYGNFDSLTTRTLFKIYPPYPTLTVARLSQVVFNYTNVIGTGVGFWFPPSFKDINFPGYTFHFIADNLKSSGSILNAKLNNITVSIGIYKSFGILKF